HALQTSRAPIDQVARDVGFEDGSALYRLVLRHTGKPPSAFR
ncbi:MAG: helix-turn-helix domain-containing protein, partial [Rhizobacter sp.]|nr:helix-turn-helix domain-containing protein [Rhizobacter sp.]